MKLLTKFAYILLACALLLSCGAVGVSAAEETQVSEPVLAGTDEFEYTLAGGEATITAYNGKANRIVIPAALDGYPVVAIGDSVFRDRTDLIRVDFEQGALRSVGNFAFYGCSALEEVLLPDTVETVGRLSFMNCTSLYRVELGDSLLEIGASAFEGCAALDGIFIPATAKYADERAFKYCTSLRTIIVASTSFTFDTDAFNTDGIQVFAPQGAAVHANTTGYNALVAVGAEALVLKKTVGGLMIEDVLGSPSCVIVPENVNGTIVSVGRGAFDKIAALQAVYLPDTITTINESAFQGCIYLRYIRMPRSLSVSPGQHVFDGCERLTRIYLPEGIETVGIECFNGCERLETVVFPKSLERIQSGAFYGCTALSTLIFRGDVPGCSFPNGTDRVVSFGSIPATARVLAEAGRNWDTAWYPNGNTYHGLAVTTRSYDCFYVEVVLTPTTCAADGLSMLVCPDCSDSFTRTYPRLPHDFISVGMNDGAETFRCKNCVENYTVKRLEIAQVSAHVDRTEQDAQMIQNVAVVFRGVTLTPDVDYTYSVEYLKNYNRLLLTVTGIGEYAGTVTAAYSSLTGNRMQAYNVTVVGDVSGTGRYYRDDVVTLTPNTPVPEGMVAVWSSEQVTVRQAYGSKGVFEMPARDVTVTLTYVKAPETTPPTPPVTTPPETTPAETTPVETTPVQTTPAQTTPAETTPAVTDPPFGGTDEARGYISRAVVLTAILVVSFVGFVVVCIFMFKKQK